MNVVMLNRKGKKLFISSNQYDSIKDYLNKKGYLFIKLNNEIILIRDKRIMGKVIWPQIFVPRKTYDLEVCGR